VIDITTVRYANTLHGDTLQQIAFREIGNADRWTDLIWINNLLPPFITDDPEQANDRVLLSGNKIALPMLQGGIDVDEKSTFGTDVALDAKGLLFAAGGDLVLMNGLPNLRGALVRRIVTEKRTKPFSPEYGCWVSMLRGDRLGAAQLSLAAFYVRSALLEDDRVKEVLTCDALGEGDALRVSATIRPIDGADITLEVFV